MRVRVDQVFVNEAEGLALRYLCRDCVHHDPVADGCAHGWPDRDHREPPRVIPGETSEHSFCKEFELE
jgi:hypothetical protein